MKSVTFVLKSTCFFRNLILIDAILRHTNESTAEALNVTTTFYFPPYVTWGRVAFINFTSPSVVNTTSAYGIALVVSL